MSSRARVVAVALALYGAGCAADAAADWTPVVRDDLIVGAELVGALEAIDSTPIKPPPIPDKWDYKIARLAEEGADVATGDVIVAFDSSDLERELMKMRNEADAAAKELEKKRSDMAMKRREDELKIAEAEAAQRKAALKAQRPADLVASKELEAAAVDKQIADLELQHARERAKQTSRHDASEMESLQDKYDYAQGRVHEIEESITKMTVVATRDGTAIFPDNWRGEKKKVGDSAWRMETVIEVVGLDNMRGKGTVDEVDASKVKQGQRVTLRLDAYPDEEVTGKVRAIGNTVQRKSASDPSKVVELEIELTDTRGLSLRPGMRFRGSVETDRLADVVVVPTEAVFVTAAGPVAYRRTANGFEKVALQLGRRSATHVEVADGLAPGDWVARTDLDVQEGR